MCKETYASEKINGGNSEIEILQKKAEKRKYKKRMYFFLGNFYISTGLLNFNNINWEYIFIEKWDLKLGLYWGIANLGLGLRINDSLLIRIIGLNLLESIPIFYVCFQFHKKKDWEEDENYHKKYITIETKEKTILDKNSNNNALDEDSNDDQKYESHLAKTYTANRTKKPMSYIKAPFLSLFNFLSIEIRLAEYWCFNINFTQTILILLKEIL